MPWNPFARKPKADTVPAVPDVEPGTGGAWDDTPGILLQQQEKDQGPSTAATASTSTAKEESTSLLGKYFGKKREAPSEHTTLSDAAAKPPPKTLKQRFQGQKAIAGIGFLLSVLVLVTAFFHSGVTMILNIAVAATGMLSCALYFFASSLNMGTRVFFWSSILCMLFGVAIFIVNLMWLINNFTSATTWLTIPFTIVALVCIGAQVGIVGMLAYRGWVHKHAERRANDALRKAQEFAATVG